jgi:hypothetical protein
MHEARDKFLSADRVLHSNNKSSGIPDQQARKLKNGLMDMPIPTMDPTVCFLTQTEQPLHALASR